MSKNASVKEKPREFDPRVANDVVMLTPCPTCNHLFRRRDLKLHKCNVRDING